MKRTVIKNALIRGEYQNIIIEDGVIAGITSEKGLAGIDAEGRQIIPGLIDTHAHGFVGFDTLDGAPEDICRFLASRGVTSWLPTAMCCDFDTLREITSQKTDCGGAQILGFHLEGPYLSPAKKGAQNEAFIKAPDFEEFSRLKNVKKITLAPEWEGAMEFIARVRALGVKVSIGHSDCDYDTACLAIENGADCLTHTFNAMPPIHHRSPGPILAASDKGIFAEIIADGVHLHPAVVRAAAKLFGKDRLMLVSDAIRPAGLPEGSVSESGGLSVTVGKDAVYLSGSDILAGSSRTLWDCVLSATKMGIPFFDAVSMASTVPAAHLNCKKGVIAEGYDADFLILSDAKTIGEVYIAGERMER